jgi:hypothetical protein
MHTLDIQKGDAMKMPGLLITLTLLAMAIGMSPNAGFAETCVDCHKSSNPGIVADWQLSKHGQAGIDCAVCHSSQHSSAGDVDKVQIPTPDTCALCHIDKVTQYKAGKHAFAWAAMKAMPTMHWQPSIITEGMKGCGGCHKIGVKTEEEIKILKKGSPGFGTAIPGIFSPPMKHDNRKPAKPATWDLITRNGKCIRLPSTASGPC